MKYTMDRNGESWDLEIRDDNGTTIRFGQNKIDQLMDRLIWYAETVDHHRQEENDENKSPNAKQLFERYRDIRNDVQTIHVAQKSMNEYVRFHSHEVYFARMILDNLLQNVRNDLRIYKEAIEDRLQEE